MYQFFAMLWKELVQVSNRRRFAMQKSLLVLGIGIFFIWAAYLEVYASSGARDYQSMARFGRDFFLMTTGLLALVLPLAAMSFAATIVTEESVRRRLPLLLATPLGSGAIVGSKALSVFARVALGLLLTMPVLALLQVFGGVEQRMVVMSVAFIVSNVWLYAAIGLWSSVVSRSATMAFAISTAATLFWNVAPLLVMAALYGFYGTQSLDVVFVLSPFAVFVLMAEARSTSMQLVMHLAINGGLGMLFLAAAFVLFRPMALSRLSGAPRSSGPRFRLPWFKRKSKPRGSPSPLAGFFRPGIVAKELASWRWTRLALPLLWLGILWGGIAMVLAADRQWSEFFDAGFHKGVFLAEALGFLLIVSVYSSTRIAGEKEALTFQTLLLTPLGPLRILAGKVAAILVEQFVVVIFLTAHLLLALVLDRASPLEAALAVSGLATSVVFSVLVGLYFSLASSKIAQAVITTVIAWFGGVYAAVLPVLVLSSLLSVRSDEAMLLYCVTTAAPACLLLAVGGLLIWRRRGFGPFRAFVSYAIVAGSAVAVTAFYLNAASDDTLGASLLILPAASLLPWTEKIKGVPCPLVFLPMQLAAIAWMAVACLATFEAQGRRAA